MREASILVVGAGPTGLTLANWFRSSHNIRVLVLEKRSHQLRRGNAEGLKSTSLEIFDSLGVGNAVEAEAWRLEEIGIWETDGSCLRRTDTIPDKVQELGKVREVMLQQGRVEELLVANLANQDLITIEHGTPTAIRSTTVSGSELVMVQCSVLTTEQPTGHGLGPISSGPCPDTNSEIGLQAANDPTQTKDTTKEDFGVQYVIGCDGAHSWTRKHLGVSVHADSKDSIFGVIDFVPLTDFPDIRKVCYLRGPDGAILLVPRSKGEVRMYVPLSPDQPVPIAEDIIRAANQVLKPYELKIYKLAWVSSYRVRQQVADTFSAQPPASDMHSGTAQEQNRVFLAGDSAHAHSPKAGQGMNIGIHDANNLGWKLRLVLDGLVSPCVLDTYETERKPVAQEFIEFDRQYVKLFSEFSPSFKDELMAGMKFTTGLATRYPESIIVWPDMRSQQETRQEETDSSNASSYRSTYEDLKHRLKADLLPGKRLPDFQVVCQADGVPTFIHKRLKATGSFRLIYFAGDLTHSWRSAELSRIGQWLQDKEHGISGWLSTSNSGYPLVEVLVVHSAPRLQVQLEDMHPVFLPFVEGMGRDYWRVYADDESAHDGHGKAYQKLNIDPTRGCAAIVRPDGYVGLIADLLDFQSICGYFLGTVHGMSLRDSLARRERAALAQC